MVRDVQGAFSYRPGVERTGCSVHHEGLSLTLALVNIRVYLILD